MSLLFLVWLIEMNFDPVYFPWNIDNTYAIGHTHGIDGIVKFWFNSDAIMKDISV